MTRPYPTRRTRFLAAALALTLVLEAVARLGIPHAPEAPSAAAAFKGANGRIAFDSNRVTAQNPEEDFEVFTMAPDGSDVIQLTGGSANDSSPAWDKDGKRIAFVSERDGNREIYTMLDDGSGQTRLTNNSANPVRDEAPAWSPDGTKIVFMRTLSASNIEVFVMNADGSGQTNLTNSPGFDGLPVWSPKGDKIAFQSDRNPPVEHEIFVMNANGSNQGRVGPGRGPDWSPDGAKIVAYHQVGNQNDIFVMGAESGNPVNINNDQANDYEPVWSPDGSQIAFTRDLITGASNIFVMNADGTDPINRTNNGAIDEAADWQPLPNVVLPRIIVGPPKFQRSGDIVFSSGRITPDNPLPPDVEIFVMQTGAPVGSSGEVKQLTINTAVDTWPEWSPDGSKIVFWSDRDHPNGEIYTMNADGSNPIRVTNNTTGELFPTWSSDGSQIAFSGAGVAEVATVFVTQADGSSNVTLISDDLFLPDWSPDGSKIVGIGGPCPDGPDCISTVNPDGTGLEHLTGSLERLSDPAWSPDGTEIAYSSCPSRGIAALLNCEIFIINADGSTPPRQLTTFRPTSGPLTGGDKGPRWSPDGKSIVFARYDRNDHPEIFTIKANGASLTNRSNSNLQTPFNDEYPDWLPRGGGQAQGVAVRAADDHRGAQVTTDKPKKDRDKPDKKKHTKKHKKKRGPHAGNRHGDDHRHHNNRHRGDERRDGNADKNEHGKKRGKGGKAKREQGGGRGGAGGRHRR